MFRLEGLGHDEEPNAASVPPECRPLNSPTDLRLVELLGAAIARSLVVYAGAGISLASNLPTGKQLSQAIYDRLESSVLTYPA